MRLRGSRGRRGITLLRGAMVTVAFAALASPLLAQDPPPEQPPPPEKKPPIQQVRVEVRVLEWRLNNTMDFDFAVLFDGGRRDGTILRAADLTLPARSPLSSAARVFLSQLDTGSGDFEAVIEALETVGEIRVLSEPMVIVSVGDAPNWQSKNVENFNYRGRVSSGTRVPYEAVAPFGGVRLATTTQYRDTGVTLECSALDIKYDQFVHLQLLATITDLTGFINIGVNDKDEPLRVPVLDNREIFNQVLVRDRSILIAGLLKSSREVERRQGIPWISELPVLKWFTSNLAKEEEVTELVFLVRPEILEPIEAAP